MDLNYGHDDNPPLPYELKGKTSRTWRYNLSAQAQAQAQAKNAYSRRRCRYKLLDLMWNLTDSFSSITVRTATAKRQRPPLPREGTSSSGIPLTPYLTRA